MSKDINKKYVLFSPIGNHDPFGKTETKVTEGPLLHIVRHYKPEIVFLFMTKEMHEKELKDNRYTKSVKHFLPNCEVNILENGFNIINAHLFDEFITPYEGVFKKIKEQYPEHEILFNVSSGTPQMISSLILEAQSSNIKTRAIQVTTPARKANIKDNYQEDDIEYVEIDYENSDNRCEEPNFNAFKKMRLKSQITVLINNYEYKAAVNLIRNDNTKLFADVVIELLEHMYYRSIFDLQNARVFASKIKIKADKLTKITNVDKNLFEYFYTIKLKQVKGELNDMILKITPFISNILRKQVEKDYDLNSIISQNDGNKPEQITRETLTKLDENLLNFLDEKFDGYKTNFVNNQVLKGIYEYIIATKISNKPEKDQNNYLSLNKLFNKFIDLEKIRNKLAHQMESVDEAKIKQVMQASSKDIVKTLEVLLTITDNFPKGKFIYNELNKELIDLL